MTDPYLNVVNNCCDIKLFNKLAMNLNVVKNCSDIKLFNKLAMYRTVVTVALLCISRVCYVAKQPI